MSAISGQGSDYEKVSMTAQMTAFMRQYSDIPFAREVAEFVQADKALERLQVEPPSAIEEVLWYAPFFELRYKSIAAVLRKSGLKQVLELASGFSLRGLAMTLQDDTLTYVETDLPGLNAQKMELVSALSRKNGLTRPPRHHFGVANALDTAQLKNDLQFFQADQPIAIVTEGLLPYLSQAEITQLTQNVCALLKAYGGVWITPDFVVKRLGQTNFSEVHARFRQAVDEETGRPLFFDAFESQEAISAFLDRMGLVAQPVKQIDEVPALSSEEVLNGETRATWEQVKPHLSLLVLKLREP